MSYDTMHGMVFQLHMVCLNSFIHVNKNLFILCLCCILVIIVDPLSVNLFRN
jgi:hypothetical protein